MMGQGFDCPLDLVRIDLNSRFIAHR
jgi:hypothetical protein